MAIVHITYTTPLIVFATKTVGTSIGSKHSFSLIHWVFLVSPHAGKRTEIGVRRISPQSVGPRRVRRQTIVEFRCHCFHYRQLPARNSWKIVMFIVIAYIPRDLVKGPVVAVGLVTLLENIMFGDEVAYGKQEYMRKGE